MSKNALGIRYESRTIFQIGEFMAKVWTVQNFWAEFPIDLRIAQTHYGLWESVKIFTQPRLQIFVNSWDLGPVWNRGIN